jgi:hypothetical protein
MVGGVLDPEKDTAEAYRTYAQELSNIWPTGESRARARDAYREYVQALSEALEPDELERRSEEAYRAYLSAIRDACAQLDPSAVEPQSLAALGQSLTAAAFMASAARHAVLQRRATRTGLAAAQGI